MGVDPPATSAVAYVRGTIDQNGQSDISNITLNPDTTTTMSTVFPDEILAALIEKAQGDGKYFIERGRHSIDHLGHRSSRGRRGERERRPQGHSQHDTDANGADSIWSADHPGILIVLNGNVDCSGQKKTLYGIVYILGGVLLTGNAEIHGMVVAKGVVDLQGHSRCQLQPGSHLESEQAGDPERADPSRHVA